MTFPILPSNAPSTGYNLTRSLRFRRSASAYLSRTPGSIGNTLKYTFSGWLKRGDLVNFQGILGGGTTSPSYDTFQFDQTTNRLGFFQSGGNTTALYTTAVFRDPSAWYHIVFAYDSAQATASNRVKIYVNNVLQTLTGTYPTLNLVSFINNTFVMALGAVAASATFINLYDGYMAEVNFIDGQALTPSSFGSTNALTGVWQPAAYTGTYGTNGFYLPFTDNSTAAALGTDFSGNSNTWTVNNISVTAGVTYDSMTDVPTLTNATTANYAVLNPLIPQSSQTLERANLYINSGGSSGSDYLIPSTIGMSNGKFYCEITQGGSVTTLVGVAKDPMSRNNFFAQYSTVNEYVYITTGQKSTNNTTTSYGASWTANDVIGIALDVTAGTLEFYKNGVSQGVAFTGLSGTFYFMWASSSSSANSANANFGQRPFAYTPPTGFVALNTFNLPTSAIVKGDTVMDVTTYTGNGTSLSVTNAAGFKPDFVWVKSRASTFNHYLSDSVRGVGVAIFSNLVNAENVDAQQLTAFNSNGFSVGSNGGMNTSGNALVGAQWQAGQGSSSSNTNGSITSTVSVNAASGFSVVTYTGTGANATVGHGIGIAPSMIFIKQRNSGTTNWRVYSSATGNTGATFLDLTNAFQVASTYWNNTSPTSSVFSLGTNGDLNASGGTYVAYCWSQIEGFSKVGSYTGNASTDGTFVYLGFRPKYIMVKRTDSAENWYWWDSIRNPYNAVNADLYPNLTNAEDTGTIRCDFLSNGFKLRSSGSPNASGGTFMYMAFAENPFKNSLAR